MKKNVLTTLLMVVGVTLGINAQDCSLFEISGLQHGTNLNSYFSGNGVNIQVIPGTGGTTDAVVYDSDGTWTEDPDLNAGVGNLMIINENPAKKDQDGNGPDDNQNGGLMIISFMDPVSVTSLLLVDFDENGSIITSYDDNNVLIKSTVIPKGADGSVQNLDFASPGTSRLEIQFAGSGGVRINLDCPCGLNLQGLAHGTRVNNLFPDVQITVTPGAGGTSDALIYDSNGNWTEDPDLNVGTGPLIIINEDPARKDGDGSGPDDNQTGGTLRFDFALPLTVKAVKAVDIDTKGGFITLYDGQDNLIIKKSMPKKADASIQWINFDVANVKRMDIFTVNSGGFDLDLECPSICERFDISQLPHGAVLNSMYSSQGVDISVFPGPGGTMDAMIYDSDGSWIEDPDLNVGIGNLIIINENPSKNDNDNKGPDDNQNGGVIRFDFTSRVNVMSLVAVDVDEPGTYLVAYDALNNPVASVPIPKGADGSIQTVLVGAMKIKRMEIYAAGSGGFVPVFDCPQVKSGIKIPSASKSVVVSSYPNPTTGIINIALTADKDSEVQIEIYDINGRLMVPAISGMAEAESQTVITYDASSLAAGFYIVKVKSGGELSDVVKILIER